MENSTLNTYTAEEPSSIQTSSRAVNNRSRGRNYRNFNRKPNLDWAQQHNESFTSEKINNECTPRRGDAWLPYRPNFRMERARFRNPVYQYRNRGRKIVPHGSREIKVDHEEKQTESNPHLDLQNLCLRETLVEKLRCAQYSCLICLSSVLPRDEIWSCDACFHMYHLKCMTDWALSSRLNKKKPEDVEQTRGTKNTWRCPSCQKAHSAAGNPLVYRCFCGKTKRPDYNPATTTIPHGCDEICGKRRNVDETISDNNNAPSCCHLCTELCHPGPCPPCVSNVRLSCPCGRVSQFLRCGEEPPSPCGAPCPHVLPKDLCAFGVHKCSLPCHIGRCPPCPRIIKAVCYCGFRDELTSCGSPDARRYNLENSVPLEAELDACDLECMAEEPDSLAADLIQKGSPDDKPIMAIFVGTVFSCQKVCDRVLQCKLHKCDAFCHAGDCASCQLLPKQCLTCPCGRTPLSKLVRSGDISGDRTRCTDAVPVCPNFCYRPNPICGHPCPSKCHSGDCPPCKLTTTISCRCGRTTKELTCNEYAGRISSGDIDILCERICKKKKSCGRHVCKTKCCDMQAHFCTERCGRMLSCEKHNCEEPCHCGPCGTCWRGVIYDDVFCHCGFTSLPPPQPCGTAPPECDQPCTRQHLCDHPVRHTCHSMSECPPCTVLLTKRCPGDHAFLYNIPCFQNVVTCGRSCDKPLVGCLHKCRRICHIGDCLPTSAEGINAESRCTQPCPLPRSECQHPCGAPCHDASQIPCSKAMEKSNPNCNAEISLTCQCGNRQEIQKCFQVKKIARQLEKKDPSIFLRANKSKLESNTLPFGLLSNSVLPCDPSCSKSKTSDGSSDNVDQSTNSGAKPWVRGGSHIQDESLPPPFPPPEYTDWLKQFALANISFSAEVEEKFFEIVSRALAPIKEFNEDDEKCPSHRFNPMKKHKRRFIHELAVFYGIETLAFDPEPHRHLLAFTSRAKAIFPGGSRLHYTSLTKTVQNDFVGTVRISNPSIMAPRINTNPTAVLSRAWHPVTSLSFSDAASTKPTSNQ